MPDMRAHALAHRPRCLAAVRATPIDLLEDRDSESVAFRLSSHSGRDSAQVLGYKLSRYNQEFSGIDFISPLFLQWVGESDAVEIFDSDLHGYHGEMDSSAKYRGEGPSELFSCPACGRGEFSVSVQFDYGEGCHDLVEDEPDLAIENYFQNFMVDGRCTHCGRIARILDMDL
jgi:hypothetical protein